jgi:hypothetical protein
MLPSQVSRSSLTLNNKGRGLAQNTGRGTELLRNKNVDWLWWTAPPTPIFPPAEYLGYHPRTAKNAESCIVFMKSPKNRRSLNCKHLFFFIFANIAGPSMLPGLRHGNVEVPQAMVQGLCGFMVWYMTISHYVHLVWSQDSVLHCTHSGSIWSTLFYTVLTAAMSDLALWLLRNPETARSLVA